MMLRLIIFFFSVLVASVSFAIKEDSAIPDKRLQQILVVNLQYIRENSLAVKDLREKIEAMTKIAHDQMAQKELEFKKQETKLRQLKNSLSASEYEKELEIFNKEIDKAQKYAQQEKLKLEKIYSDGIKQVEKHSNLIVEELCKSCGCSIVIPASLLIYFDEALNVSTQVLEQLNKKITSININH